MGSFFSSIGEYIAKWWNEGAKYSIIDWLRTKGVPVLNCVIILVVGLWVAKLITKIVTKALRGSRADEGIAGFLSSCINFVLKMVVIIAAIAALGVNISSIITALGAAGITIGLAMQDSLSNFASGVLILYNKPFVIGDFVEVDGSTGTVKSIELMHTVLITPENKELVFPNSVITKNKIINYTGLEARRLDMKFPVAYGSDISKVKKCISDVCESSQYRIPGGAETVIGIDEFGRSAVVFETRMWIKANEYWAAYYDMQERMLAEFEKSGITIPFDQMDVHIKNN